MGSHSTGHEDLHEKPHKDPTQDSSVAGPVDYQTPEEEPTNTENEAPEPSAARLHQLEMGRQAAARFRENKKRQDETLAAREAALGQQRDELREDVLCMRETILEYQTLLMSHKDCPQYRANDGYCVHQILASIERLKGLFDYVHEDEEIRSLRAALLGEPNVQLQPTPPPDQPTACGCRPYASSEDRPKKIAG